MLEFALVIPIFVFVLYGLIAFGVMLSGKQTITHAASEGARAAVGAAPNDAAQIDAAKKRVKDAMSSLSQYNVDDPAEFSAVPAQCPAPSLQRCITVTVTYPYSDKPLVPEAPGLGLVMPNTLKSVAVVQVS